MDFNLIRFFYIFDFVKQPILVDMLNEYIKELIASNNRVIIPNFGAFLLRATSKNKNKKDLASKIDDIYFSPFLKFNDELLVNHIMKNEEIDQKSALDKISDYIKSIEEGVEKNGVFTIEGLGEFYQDAQGKVQFKIHSSETETGEEASQKETKKSASEKPKETPPKATKADKKTVNEKAANTKKQEPRKEATKSTERKEEPKKEPAPKAAAQKASASQKVTSKQPVQKQKKGTNKGLVLSIAIGLPIAAIFIWAMLNFDSVQKIFSKKEEAPKQTTEKVTKEPKKEDKKAAGQDETKEQAAAGDKTTKDQQAKAQNTKDSKPEKTTTQPKEKKFYIVAGSFRNKDNAIKYRDKLIDQGYKSELIGERNGMHAVSYSSFKSKRKAEAELSMLRRKGLQAWLLYY